LTLTADGRGTVTVDFHARDTIPYVLLLLGLASLFTSVFFSSYVLAFIGLGLTFWGALFLYIKSTKYVKLELLNAASSSSLDNIERILTTIEIDLKGIHLPPKNLVDYTSSLVFIPARPNQPLPSSVETSPKELHSTNPSGLLITPPGLALSKLFEKELKRLFTETTLSELQTQLPKLFEELQITKHMSLTFQAKTITVTTSNNVFKDLSEEARKLEKTYMLVGSPMASALACIFAKATGKPITIEKEETTLEGTTTTIQHSGGLDKCRYSSTSGTSAYGSQ
jgi:hypothetical protein